MASGAEIEYRVAVEDLIRDGLLARAIVRGTTAALNDYELTRLGLSRRAGENVRIGTRREDGRLVPTYSQPFDLLVGGNETGYWRGRRDSNPRPPA